MFVVNRSQTQTNLSSNSYICLEVNAYCNTVEVFTCSFNPSSI